MRTDTTCALIAQPVLLVVDDNPAVCETLAEVLEHSGYRVLVADCADDALSLLDEHRVDLAVLDLLMPGLSGSDLLRLVRTRFRPAQLPIIVNSSCADPDAMATALEDGANDYVTKPLDYPVLLARIQAQLRNAASARKVASAAEPTDEPDQRVGQVLKGRYELLERVGEGACAAVYRALDQASDTDVAIKLLNGDLAGQPEGKARFQREAHSALKVNHPQCAQGARFWLRRRSPPLHRHGVSLG